MSYTRVSPNTIELDTGAYVHITVHATRINGGGVAILATARQIDTTGAIVRDANGDTIESACAHTFDAGTVASHGAEACAKDCALLALGEAPLLFGHALPELSDEVMASYSIRNAITAAKHAGPVDVASIL